ncbi:MAG: MFS transporter [Acidimicrobiia bacterium]
MGRFGELVARSEGLRALRRRNFRLYFIGQLVSMCGTSAQVIAVPWLVLKLTGSGTRVGLVTAIQFVPVLLVGAWAGVIVDRYENRRIVLIVQTALGIQAAALATIVLTDVVRLWMVYGLAAIQGAIMAFDTPSRQSLVGEIVGDDDLPNALALNVGIMQTSRVIGPLVAGVLIETIGIGLCFAFNAVSYVAIVGIVLAMDRSQLRARRKAGTKGGETMEGLRYTVRNRELRNLLVLYLVIAVFTGNQATFMPLLAEFVFHGGAGTYTLIAAVSGVGAVLAAFGVVARYKPTKGFIFVGLIALFASFVVAAIAPNLGIELVAMFVMGAASTMAGVATNASLQLGCRPEYRGRVIALFFMAAFGSNVAGAPLVGWISQTFGTRWAVGMGAIAAGVAVIAVYVRWHGLFDEPGACPDREPAAGVVGVADATVPSTASAR